MRDILYKHPFNTHDSVPFSVLPPVIKIFTLIYVPGHLRDPDKLLTPHNREEEIYRSIGFFTVRIDAPIKSVIFQRASPDSVFN